MKDRIRGSVKRGLSGKLTPPWIPLLLCLAVNCAAHAQWAKVETGIVYCFTNDTVYIYAGHAGGVYFPGDSSVARNVIRSSDNGASWENVSSGLTSRSMYSINIFSLASKGGKLFAGTDNGIFSSTDQGGSWTQLDVAPWKGEVHSIFVDGPNILAGFDAGDSNCSDTVGGVFRSLDDGKTWLAANSGLRSNCMDKRIYAFARIGSTLFAGAWGGGVFTSVDSGANWAPHGNKNPTEGWQVTSLAVIDSTLFMGGWAPSCFRSPDEGLTWIRCEKGITDTTTYDSYALQGFAVSDHTLFTGTIMHGIYRSSNMGDEWIPENSNLEYEPLSLDIFSLSVIDGYAFVGSGGGVYRIPVSTIASVKQNGSSPPGEISLGQNYPNPFNPTTTIRYGLPAKSHVTLTVFNTLGQQVAVLQNGEQEAGYHSVRFDGSRLASGVYFYRLQAGTYVETRKLVLLR